MRRLQGLGEPGLENIVLIFLDWEKAFDKVSHTKLFESLERLSLHPKILCNIKAYTKRQNFEPDRAMVPVTGKFNIQE